MRGSNSTGSWSNAWRHPRFTLPDRTMCNLAGRVWYSTPVNSRVGIVRHPCWIIPCCVHSNDVVVTATWSTRAKETWYISWIHSKSEYGVQSYLYVTLPTLSWLSNLVLRGLTQPRCETGLSTIHLTPLDHTRNYPVSKGVNTKQGRPARISSDSSNVNKPDPGTNGSFLKIPPHSRHRTDRRRHFVPETVNLTPCISPKMCFSMGQVFDRNALYPVGIHGR